LAITTDLSGYGVILEPWQPENITNYTIDTAITDEEWVWVLRLPCPRGVTWVGFLEALAGPVALVPGTVVHIGLEAGKIRKFVWVTTVAATETLEDALGRIAVPCAGNATADLIVEVGSL
jgi:hypothetical protein